MTNVRIQILDALRLTPEALRVMQFAVTDCDLDDDLEVVQRFLNAHLDYTRWAVERTGSTVSLVRVSRQHAEDGEVVATITATDMIAGGAFPISPVMS